MIKFFLKLKDILNKLKIHISYISTKKNLAAKQIRTNKSFPIKKGFWFIGTEFSRSIDVMLPPPLNNAKIWGGWRNDKATVFIMKIIDALIYPWFIWRPNVDHHYDSCASIFLITRTGEIIGFDIDNQVVLKKKDSNRLAFSKHAQECIGNIYSLPIFKEDNMFFIEQFIQGETFSSTTKEKRETIMLSFLRNICYADKQVLSPQKEEYWRNNSVTLIKRFPIVLQRQLTESVCYIMKNCRVSYTHGDLFGENIIVSAKGKPFAIDYDRLEIGPSFCDPFTLLVFEFRVNNKDLFDHFISGNYDHFLKKLSLINGNYESSIEKSSIIIGWLSWKMTSEKFSEVNIKRLLEPANVILDLLHVVK